MLGGLMPPPELVTEKVSVRHCDWAETGTAPAGETTPLLAATLATDVVEVDGPVITKVSKSRRIWNHVPNTIYLYILYVCVVPKA